MASRMPDENYITLVEHVKELNQKDESLRQEQLNTQKKL